MIRQIHDRAVLVRNAIADGRAWVADERCLNVERSDLKGGARYMVAGDARQIAKVDRKERRREIAGQARSERKCAARRSPDVDIDLGVI